MTTTVERLDPEARRYAGWALGAGLLATGIWLWLQLDLLDDRVFGNFYDIQARALLDGDLAVPAGTLGNEAFVARGLEYLYNPPGPSLLRMPLFVLTDRFDGRLTVSSMLLAWVLTVVLTALLVWRLRRLLRPRAALPHWEAATLAAFVVTATVGTTVLYLGAVPWVFHEAYAWAVPMAIGVAFALVGVLVRPSTGGALAVGAFTLGAVLSRATAGFACAIGVVAVAVWCGWRARRAGDDRAVRRGLALASAGAVPVLVGVAVNWAKFRHPWVFPIEDQIFTQLSQLRRDAIAANGGDLFGADLVPSTVAAYLRPDGIRFSGLFPFVSLPAEPAPTFGGAFVEQSFRTGSIVSFMPALVVLAAWGAVTSVRVGRRRPDLPLWLVVGAMALVPSGVFVGAYITHRYTAEFVPFLVVAGALGVVDVCGRLGRRPTAQRDGVLAGLALLALFGVLANVAVAVSAQALANPGEVLSDHLGRQERLSPVLGGALEDRVEAVAALPERAPADTVAVVGDCEAVYVATGEVATPWVEAAVRPLRWRVAVLGSPPSRASGVALAEFSGHRRSVLVVERSPDGALALVVRGGGRDERADLGPRAVGSLVPVEVRTGRVDDHEIVADGEVVLRLPKESRDQDWLWLPNVLAARPVDDGAARAAGLQVDPSPTETPGVCRTLGADGS